MHETTIKDIIRTAGQTLRVAALVTIPVFFVLRTAIAFGMVG